VQGFFANLLARDGLSKVKRDRGLFRAYLLAALKKHMAGEWRRAHREKRGGYQPHLSLDRDSAETGLNLDLEDTRSPDRLFDQDWARSLLDHVLAGLEQEYSRKGKQREFKAMKSYLAMDSQRAAYAELAGELDMTEAAARVAVHRLRKRYRQNLRQEVAGTLSCPTQVEEEMNALLTALSG
jgi:DNA-directed RNA polymerase specialized sigma24 family protein